MGTYILDKKAVVNFNLKPDVYNVLIRIANPNTRFVDIENEQVYRDIIYLQFFDFEDEESGLYLFNETHLEKILDFFRKHTHCMNMVIHCDEGRSRSAGIAVGWFLFNDVRSSIYQLYHDGVHAPNKRVVEFFYRHFGISMNSIEKWENESPG
jgi:predicted protein tyrosine phosphatase